MKRVALKLLCAVGLFGASLSCGCTGNNEITPDQVQTPTVDPAAVQKERDRAMEMMKKQRPQP